MYRAATVGIVLAQAMALQAAGLEFEVATVRPNKPNSTAGVRGGCHGIDSKYTATEAASAPPLGRCVITDGRLNHMVNIAWVMGAMNLIKGGPDWSIAGYDDRFDLNAKADDPKKYTEAQLREMLQNLLVERFKIKYHLETTEKAGFAMVVGKKGPKLQSSKSEEPAVSFGSQLKPAPGQPIDLRMRKTTMAALANLLSQIGGAPVMDRTGLTGEYDFTLYWDETNGPALSTAVQEQLGLKFESQRVPISTFVIDSAERPGEN